jgi:murein DD-endopeptidase MepM/ murein hydrolase activator NlpD
MNALKSKAQQNKEGDLYRSEDSSVARGYLPLKLTLELDGISNIIKYQGFLIPANRLPGQYKENETTVNVGFIVSDLTHVIQGQSWILNLGGQMVIKPGAKTKILGYSDLGKKAQAAGGVSPVINTTPPSSVSKLGFGLPTSLPYRFNSLVGRAQSKTYNKKVDAKSTHFGIDMIGPSLGVRNTELSNQVGGNGTSGDVIFSIGDGRVLVSGPVGGFGNAIYILHQIDSQIYTSIYGHVPLASLKVKAGELVQKGTPLALIGNEGNSFGFHLHFELWKGERRGPGSPGTEVCDPLDYLPFFAANGGVITGDVAYAGIKYGGSDASPKVISQGTGQSVKKIEAKPILSSTKDLAKF